jgi:ABC-type multidrug transport system fused ATPase/permease subunit
MKVAQTELSLSSQHDGDERFSSTAVSRSLVRFALTLGNFYNYVVPTSLQKKINDRFIPLPEEERTSASYDMIRSVVNLSAASILICIGTSFQLPLSTTYVVFMVAMGSSLADRAWGRESAVYRITGVMVVIAGWFVTAIAGFIMSFLIGMFLMSTKWVALIILVVFCIYKFTSGFFRKNKKDETTYESVAPSENDHDTLYNYTEVICTTMQQISEIYNHMLIALFTEDRKALREAKQQSEQLYKEASQRKYEILPTIRSLQDRRIETAHFYVQVVDYLCEVTKALLHCTRPAYEHIDNNHRGLTEEQILDLKVVNDEVENIFSSINTMLQAHDFANMPSVLDMREALFDIIAERIKNQIHRIKGGEASTRGSALYFNILNETKTMILQSRNVLKSQSYFYESMN